ncbi:hypothetical protein AEQ27_09970 [Frigoribacterium sp. RIT-PI-h]|nr:hypothetical protein AEQ27_09970 [Frigoribacterium sp. RIT-PI-h]
MVQSMAGDESLTLQRSKGGRGGGSVDTDEVAELADGGGDGCFTGAEHEVGEADEDAAVGGGAVGAGEPPRVDRKAVLQLLDAGDDRVELRQVSCPLRCRPRGT